MLLLATGGAAMAVSSMPTELAPLRGTVYRTTDTLSRRANGVIKPLDPTIRIKRSFSDNTHGQMDRLDQSIKAKVYRALGYASRPTAQQTQHCQLLMLFKRTRYSPPVRLARTSTSVFRRASRRYSCFFRLVHSHFSRSHFRLH